MESISCTPILASWYLCTHYMYVQCFLLLSSMERMLYALHLVQFSSSFSFDNPGNAAFPIDRRLSCRSGGGGGGGEGEGWGGGGGPLVGGGDDIITEGYVLDLWVMPNGADLPVSFPGKTPSFPGKPHHSGKKVTSGSI